MTPGSEELQGFLGLLDPGERDGVLTLGVLRAFPRGSLLMFEKEPGERVMILTSGRAKVSRLDEKGRELLLSIRDPGDVLGELAFLDDQPRIASVHALEPAEAVVIPSQAFRAHLERTPRIAVALLSVVASRFRDATVMRAQFAASDTLGRMAARILELAERYGDGGDAEITIDSPLSQEELAAWAGASRAGAAQALQTMRDLAWIETNRRRITIRNVEALRQRGA